MERHPSEEQLPGGSLAGQGLLFGVEFGWEETLNPKP
jgi:hypothetical protein